MIKRLKQKLADKKSKDDFAEYCKTQEIVKAMNYHDHIKAARQRIIKTGHPAYMTSATAFINSCEEHLNKRGFLSDKQIKVLETVHESRADFDTPDDWGGDDGHGYDDYGYDGDSDYINFIPNRY